MKRFTILAAALMTAFLAGGPAGTHAADYKPAFDFEHVLSTDFYESGLIAFTQYNVAFAPDEPVDAGIEVFSEGGERLAGFKFFPEYKVREKVFGRLLAQGPADVTLPKEGNYELRFSVGGEVATRLPFSMEVKSAGDDPFNPEKTYRFTGPWQRWAYLQPDTFKDTPIVSLVYWPGGTDIPKDAKKEMVKAEVYRDGTLIGHSKETQGFLGHTHMEHYQREDLGLYLPHERKGEPNAVPLPTAEVAKDGAYEIKVKRQSEGKVIRSFKFKAAGGKIQHHPRSALGYSPNADYILSRVQKKGATSIAYEEVYWIESDL